MITGRTELVYFHCHTLIYETEKRLRYISRLFTLPVYNMQLRNIGKKQFALGSNSTWLDSTRLDTFEVSSPCILAVSS